MCLPRTEDRAGRRLRSKEDAMAEKRCAAKRSLIAAVVAYAAIWLACFVLYRTSLLTGALDGGAIAGYTLLVLYILLPAASVISSFLVGCVSDFGWWRLVAPLAACVFCPLFIMATFGLSTEFGLANVANTDFFAVAVGFAPAALGLAVGWLVSSRRAGGFCR